VVAGSLWERSGRGGFFVVGRKAVRGKKGGG